MTKFAIAVLVLLSGCATGRPPATAMNSAPIDCRNKDAQIAYYEAQLTTADQRMWSGLIVNTPIGTIMSAITGNYVENRRVYDRTYDAIARDKIATLRTYC